MACRVEMRVCYYIIIMPVETFWCNAWWPCPWTGLLLLRIFCLFLSIHIIHITTHSDIQYFKWCSRVGIKRLSISCEICEVRFDKNNKIYKYEFINIFFFLTMKSPRCGSLRPSRHAKWTKDYDGGRGRIDRLVNDASAVRLCVSLRITKCKT